MTVNDRNGIPPELDTTLGDRLKKSLKYSGLTVGDMAAYMEVHRNTISGWLAGRAKPMPILLRFWSDKTGVPIEWLRDNKWPNTPREESAGPAKVTPIRKTAQKVAPKKRPVKVAARSARR